MILIFIGSYLNVPCVIDTIEREKSEFRILSSNKEVICFFSDFYNPSVVIELPYFFSSFRNPLLLIKDFIKITYNKRFFLKKLKKLHPQKVLFFYVGWNGFAYWLIKSLSLEAAIYYRPKINVEVLKEIREIRPRIRAKIMSILFNIRCSPLQLYHYKFLGISQKFLKEIKVRTYPAIQDNDVVFKVLKKRSPELNRIKVLLLIGIEHNMDMTEYNEKHQAVIKILLDNFSLEEIALKQHPNLVIDDFNIPEGLTVIPNSFPANLICYNTDIVISYASATLFEAADLGKTAISLAYMIKSTHPEQADSCKQYLIDNTKHKIMFPKNIDEFKSVLFQATAKKP
jgi:hypothetical protein